MLSEMPQGGFRQIKVRPLCVPQGRYDGEGGGMRVYDSGTGDQAGMYASVTAMLSHSAASDKKEGLRAWRDRVGGDVADHIAGTAANVGSMAHELMEFYVQNKIHPKFPRSPLLARAHFENLRDAVDGHADCVRGAEVQIFSRELRLAGTIDLVAEWDGRLSIIDFKTNRRSKPLAQLEDYFIQTSIYAHMYGEAYFADPLLIRQGVVVIIREDALGADFHVVDTHAVRDAWKERLDGFHRDMADTIRESARAAAERRDSLNSLWSGGSGGGNDCEPEAAPDKKIPAPETLFSRTPGAAADRRARRRASVSALAAGV